MRLTTADLVVLAVVLFDRPMHGYQLVSKLEKSHVEDWASVSRPQVYYSLRKLAKHGYLKADVDEQNSLGPERIVYKPTAKASRETNKALMEEKWVKRHPPEPFTTWSVLALNAPASVVCDVVSKRADMLKAEIEREQQSLRSLDSTKEHANINVARELIKIAIRKFKVELDSLDDLKAAILTGKLL